MTGRRTYTADQAVAFSDLYRALDLAVPTSDLDDLESVRSEQRKGFEENSDLLIRKAERRLERVEAEWQSALTKHEDYQRGWRTCLKMMDHPNLSSEQRQWLEKRQEHLSILLKEYSFTKIKQLEAKVTGIKAELEVLTST